MRDEDMRKLVERLIGGAAFHPRDLDRLYFRLRERSFGAPLVREVGDFIAHAHVKDRGLTTNEARDFFTVLRFVVPNLLEPGFDAHDLPATIIPAYHANFRRIGPAGMKRETGLGHRAAKAALESGLGKLVEGPSAGRLRLSGNLTENEAKVLRCCGRYASIPRPAFTGDQLFNELRVVLEKNNLLKNSEKARFDGLESAVVLHAVAAMHRAQVLLEDQSRAELFGVVFDGLIEVNVRSGVRNPYGVIVPIAGSMLVTGLKAAEHCDPQLAQEQVPWSGPVELTVDRRLVPL